MTYKNYIDKLNRLYAKRHQKLFALVDTVGDGTFPVLEISYDNEDEIKYINVAEEIEKIDKKIYTLVLEASEEPWYSTHRYRFGQSLDILINGVPCGILSEKPQKNFSDFTF